MTQTPKQATRSSQEKIPSSSLPLSSWIPHSKDAEMMVLGGMISSLDGLNMGADQLEETSFFFPEHRLIFQVLKAAYKDDRPTDLYLLVEELKRIGDLEKAGGMGYLTTIAQSSGTASFLEEYIEIVRNKALLREIIQTAQRVEKEALKDPKEVDELLDQVQQQFFNISQQARSQAGISIQQLLSGFHTNSNLPFLKELERRQEEYQKRGAHDPGITGISTGLIDLDWILNGLGLSNMIILAARPGMGKTALGLNIAEHVCFHQNKAVGIFSLEMTAEQVLHRMIASQSEVEAEKLARGSLNGNEYQKVVASCAIMQQKKMLIDDTPGLKITDLRARARRMKETHNIELLVVDYLQLISGSGQARSIESRQNEISEISRMLKTLARELNIPVICLSQLSRKVEERVGHRPMMSDLRESGSIEQDADVVMFLLRREYYDPMDKPGLAELIISKNRHGQVGSLELIFRKEIAQFANFLKNARS